MIALRHQIAIPVSGRPVLMLIVAVFLLAVLPLAHVRPPAIAIHAPAVAPDFGRLPLAFVPNAGQAAPADPRPAPRRQRRDHPGSLRGRRSRPGRLLGQGLRS